MLGNRLFVGTLDAALVALDARTGLPLWETQVADTMLGHSLTSPPLMVKDKVLVGITGGEFAPARIPRCLRCRDRKTAVAIVLSARTGRVRPRHLAGRQLEAWRQSDVARPARYDPELNTVYWTVGNPGPQIDRSVRGDLDNLFSDSVVALDPDTGQRKWHYQFTPNDGHDWDSAQDLILVDRMWHGQMRKLLLHADRNGYFYVLDRTNGKFLSGTPFVYTNWNAGFDANGRPNPVPGSNSSSERKLLRLPHARRRHEFPGAVVQPDHRLDVSRICRKRSAVRQRAAVPEKGRQHGHGGRTIAGPAPARGPNEPAPTAGIKALDPETGKTMWDFKIFQGSLDQWRARDRRQRAVRLSRDGNLVALDAKTGKHLWHSRPAATTRRRQSVMRWMAVRYIALTAGNVLFSFTLPQ